MFQLYKRKVQRWGANDPVSLDETQSTVTYFAKNTDKTYRDEAYSITVFKSSQFLHKSASSLLDIDSSYFVNKHAQFSEKTGRNEVETFIVTDYVDCGSLK